MVETTWLGRRGGPGNRKICFGRCAFPQFGATDLMSCRPKASRKLTARDDKCAVGIRACLGKPEGYSDRVGVASLRKLPYTDTASADPERREPPGCCIRSTLTYFL